MADEQPLPKLEDIPSHEELDHRTTSATAPGKQTDVKTAPSPAQETPSTQQARKDSSPPKKRDLPRLPLPHWSGRTWVFLGLGILGLGLIVFFAFFYRATLTITAQPDSAAIIVDETQVSGQFRGMLTPGEHTLRVTAPGFIPYESILSLGVGEERQLSIALRPLPQPTTLTDQQVQFVVLDQERASLLYLAPEERTAFRLFPDDLDEPVLDEITPAVLENIADMIWSPERQLAFLKVNGATKLYDFKRYDLVNQEIRDWPGGIGSVDWRPDGEKVAYAFAPDTGERTIIRANRDNSEAERIFNFAATDIVNPIIAWSPDAKYLSVLTDKLYLLDVFSKSLTELVTDERVAAVRWLPDSSGLVYEDGNARLKVVELDATKRDLGQTGSLVQLALFADSQTAVLAKNRGQASELLRIDLLTGETVPYVFQPIPTLAMRDLLLSADETVVYFRSAGELFALPLDTGEY